MNNQYSEQQTNNAVSQLANNLLGNADNLNKLTKKSDGTAKTIEEIEEEFLISAISSPKPTGSESASGTLPPEIIDKREYNRQLEEYQRLLKELKTIKELIDKYQSIREKELLDRLSRKNELIAKGYSDRDIERLKIWDLLDQEIPDLNAKKRIGVTNILYTCGEGREKVGGSNDLIIFLKPQHENLPRAPPRVNFSNNIVGRHSQKSYKSYKEYYEQIVRNFLVQNGKFNHDAYVLVKSDNSMSGDSAGIGFYLALHSLVNRIPLPRNLGSTGTVEGQKGYQRFNPGYVTSDPEENWFDNFPDDLTEKIKQVEFVSFTSEIPLALERILNPGMAPRNVPIPPEPQTMEIQATPEQFFALVADNMIGRQETKKVDENTWESERTIPNPELGEIYQVTAKKRAVEQSRITNEQKITEIEKEIAGHKQAKANEEVILENVNRQIEENRQNPNQNPDQNLEADKQAVSQRIAELSAKIASSEEEIANLRQNQQELIKE
ncbi:636_t:CDS:2, partial [Entrophospora sp. SA101]